jgi:hypothetical protein
VRDGESKPLIEGDILFLLRRESDRMVGVGTRGDPKFAHEKLSSDPATLQFLANHHVVEVPVWLAAESLRKMHFDCLSYLERSTNAQESKFHWREKKPRSDLAKKASLGGIRVRPEAHRVDASVLYEAEAGFETRLCPQVCAQQPSELRISQVGIRANVNVCRIREERSSQEITGGREQFSVETLRLLHDALSRIDDEWLPGPSFQFGPISLARLTYAAR